MTTKKELGICETCKDFHFTDEACRPLFTVQMCTESLKYTGERKVHAIDHAHAARCYVVREWYDMDRRTLMEQSIVVDVTDADGITNRYQVCVDYYVNQIGNNR